jgi:hypothetical protein
MATTPATTPPITGPIGIEDLLDVVRALLMNVELSELKLRLEYVRAAMLDELRVFVVVSPLAADQMKCL